MTLTAQRPGGAQRGGGDGEDDAHGSDATCVT
jgi:hypothetical protein